jgi:glyoxylase I family protein
MAFTRGLHHVVLTVTDIERSTEFYTKIFKLTLGTDEGPGSVLWDDVVLLCLQQAPHAPIPNDRFDENRLGLDHLAFAVPSRTELEETVETLNAMGVATEGIEFDPDGQSEYVCFRDPDNIQVEVYVSDRL